MPVTTRQVIELAISLPPTAQPVKVLIALVMEQYQVTNNIAGGVVRRCLERGLITQKWEQPSPDGTMICRWVEVGQTVSNSQTNVMQLIGGVS